MSKLTVKRGRYRIVWHGGEYAEVMHPAFDYAVEVINMTLADGSLPPMTREVLRAEVDEASLAEWDQTVNEMLRYPAAGVR